LNPEPVTMVPISMIESLSGSSPLGSLSIQLKWSLLLMSIARKEPSAPALPHALD
jgi:hypothetical protein